MLFSVILPVYNVEKYLRQCVDSILAQTCQDFELILVDDGSKDGSGDICDEYAEKDERIKVIHKHNGGQSTARNEGLRVAQGEYIAYLDSDDFYLHEHVLEQVAQKCDAHPDIVAFKYKKYFDVTGEYGICSYSFADIPEESYCDMIKRLIQKDAFFCSAWSKVVKRSILEENQIFFNEHSRCEDMDWYFNVITHSQSMKLVDDVMIGYRQRDNSVTSTKSVQTIDDFLDFLNTWILAVQKLPDSELSSVLQSALAKLFVNLMIAYCTLADVQKKSRFPELQKYASLLMQSMNPRVKKVRMMTHLVGFRATMCLFNIALKVR